MEGIEILIREDGVLVGSPFTEEKGEFIPSPVTDLGSRLAKLAAPKNPSSTSIQIYIAENLLFFKSLTLPLQTPDIKEAVNFQLSMLVPFEEEMLHGYTTTRTKEAYNISLYAVPSEKVVPFLEEIAAAGFQLSGLFPESQRFVTQVTKQQDWGLLLPGPLPKLLVFSANSIRDRLLCYSEPSKEGLASLGGTDLIYSSSPQEEDEFENATDLLVEKPLHKEFNLLPSSYRRPDYLRYLILGLCILNVFALLAVATIKEYKVKSLLTHLDTQVAEIYPKVKEVEKLRIEEKELSESIERIEGIGQNFDIIRFLSKVTNELPQNSYLDQVRMDKRTKSINLQGYTEDLTELTNNLDNLDQAKLKSTRRRKNKTYFHVEISTP
ncbi:MAG: hypothetical protein KQH63_06645 [Desulfobulbaceae bacterium]|nr:hypothetical protein [Desulfobulbaceae bacterium]